jgi:hypothetical protein
MLALHRRHQLGNSGHRPVLGQRRQSLGEESSTAGASSGSALREHPGPQHRPARRRGREKAGSKLAPSA